MMILNKREKRNLYLGIMEIIELVLLLITTIISYSSGLGIYVYTFVVGVVPFILTVLQFYPTMDLFKRKGNMNKVEWAELIGFVVVLVFYIVCLYLLNDNII